jgi:DNA-binding transcriptional regulator YiaG
MSLDGLGSQLGREDRAWAEVVDAIPDERWEGLEDDVGRRPSGTLTGAIAAQLGRKLPDPLTGAMVVTLRESLQLTRPQFCAYGVGPQLLGRWENRLDQPLRPEARAAVIRAIANRLAANRESERRRTACTGDKPMPEQTTIKKITLPMPEERTGEWVTNIVKQRGLTPEQFAVLSEIPLSTIVAWSRDKGRKKVIMPLAARAIVHLLNSDLPERLKALLAEAA